MFSIALSFELGKGCSGISNPREAVSRFDRAADKSPIALDGCLAFSKRSINFHLSSCRRGSAVCVRRIWKLPLDQVFRRRAGNHFIADLAGGQSQGRHWPRTCRSRSTMDGSHGQEPAVGPARGRRAAKGRYRPIGCNSVRAPTGPSVGLTVFCPRGSFSLRSIVPG